ncbi:glycosyltransferase family 39 protein [Candidatus Woesebacteria bacterium]|nr:glycosyltransferase family 39 protein [Candidatus Woesebacteria bacterium]
MNNILKRFTSREFLELLVVLLVPITSFVIAFFTLNHYGVNWDEPYHYRRGQAFLHYYLTGNKTYEGIPKYPPLKGDPDSPGFRNTNEVFYSVQRNPSLSDPAFRRSYYQDDAWDGKYFIDQENSYGHPPLNDILAAFSNYIFYQKLGILGDLESYHLFIISAVSLSAFFVAIFMWKEFGLIESIISSLTLVSYPLILGEQHFNIKDPVEASFFTIVLLAFYLAITKNRIHWLIVAIIFFGLALSTKFNIVFSLIPMALLFFYLVFKNRERASFRPFLKKVLIILVISPIIVLGMLIASYPTIWKNPVVGLLQIVRFYMEVGYSKSQPNPYYLFGFLNTYPLIWIFYTTPPIVLFLIFSFLPRLKKSLRKSSFIILLLLWLLVTIGRNSLFGALSYGGVRLIMEYIPALAMISGISAGYLTKFINNRNYLILIFTFIILGFLPTFYKLYKIHPNENVYFNFLIGGLSGAKEKNLNSWGNSNGNAYYPSIIWLNEHADKNAKLSLPIALTSNIPRYKLRGDIAVSPFYWSGLRHEGEYLIELTYDYQAMDWFSLNYLNAAMAPVYEVKVDGIPIAKVWKNDESHILPTFRNTKIDKSIVVVDKKAKNIKLTLPKSEKVLSVRIIQPVKDCKQVNTGYVQTSLDGKTWSRETEDMALDQLDRQEIKKFDSNFDYYFVGKKIKFLIFNVDSEESCPLKSREALVTSLSND